MSSPTKAYHQDTYAAIDPTQASLSTAGKHVLVTGGGAGIGSHIVRSFARSGAASVAILGRTLSTLEKQKAIVEKLVAAAGGTTKVYVYEADLVDAASLERAFAAYTAATGAPVDVLVANAGYLPDLAPIDALDEKQLVTGFDVNVTGNFHLIRAFLKHGNPKGTVLNLTSAIAHLPYVPGWVGYETSKLAGTKLFEYLHHEKPDLFVASFHPGVIRTDMLARAEAMGAQFTYEEGECCPIPLPSLSCFVLQPVS